MIKPDSPEQLATDILKRSICSVQVGAVITDAGGSIISWGWNSMGASGYGECAEAAAFRRANKSRLWYGTIYVAGQRKRNRKVVGSKPCESCQALIDKYKLEVAYRNGWDKWVGNTWSLHHD